METENEKKGDLREGVSLGGVQVPVRSWIKSSSVPSATPEHIISKCDSFILREFEFISFFLSRKGRIPETHV